ncbi:MAG: YlmC/YmxH family sporulation protein [Huintestinicola sp.]|uniref:YlmC/YmxH family sporulation protein n=1 Tax=Huintestinicola sp. TaxID=2981661 RepID=UPI003F09F84E
MKCTFSELREREVISTSTGARIGFIDDLLIDTETGKILSLIIYGRSRMMGIMGREDDVVIACSDIEKIGTDTVLVSADDDVLCRVNKDRRNNLFE